MSRIDFEIIRSRSFWFGIPLTFAFIGVLKFLYFLIR